MVTVLAKGVIQKGPTLVAINEGTSGSSSGPRCQKMTSSWLKRQTNTSSSYLYPDYEADQSDNFHCAVVSVGQGSGFFDPNNENGGEGIASSSTSSSSREEFQTETPKEVLTYHDLTEYGKYEQSSIPHPQLRKYTHRPPAGHWEKDVNRPTTSKKNGYDFRISLRQIPTWDIYFHDQKHRLMTFYDPYTRIHCNSEINRRVSICFEKNSLTKLILDVIVCPTDEKYSKEAGVAKLLREELGPILSEACSRLPPCQLGSVEITEGFQLPVTHIFHVNGPNATDNPMDFEEILQQCYWACFTQLANLRLRTIGIPCISTGMKGIPKNIAAKIALRTTRRFLELNAKKIDRIVFFLQNKRDIDIYLRLMQIYFPVL